MRITYNSKQFKKDYKRAKTVHAKDFQLLLKAINDLAEETVGIFC